MGGTEKGTACHPLMTVRQPFADGQRRTERDWNCWLCFCWHDEREVRSDVRLDRHAPTLRPGPATPAAVTHTQIANRITRPRRCSADPPPRRPICRPPRPHRPRRIDPRNLTRILDFSYVRARQGRRRERPDAGATTEDGRCRAVHRQRRAHRHLRDPSHRRTAVVLLVEPRVLLFHERGHAHSAAGWSSPQSRFHRPRGLSTEIGRGLLFARSASEQREPAIGQNGSSRIRAMHASRPSVRDARDCIKAGRRRRLTFLLHSRRLVHRAAACCRWRRAWIAS